MYVSPWPSLATNDFERTAAGRLAPFPLDAPHSTYFCLARSAIYHLFRALRLQPNEVVLVPDYHSGNEISAMRAAGVPLVYYRIGRNLEPDLDELSRLARQNVRALYVIHYLGWPQPIREILALCRDRGILLVEDCALSLFSEAGNGPLGSFGQYSVFCLYKTLPLPNGGLLVQNRDPLKELSRLELQRCPKLATLGRTAELLLEGVRSRSEVVGKALVGLKRAVGRTLRAGGASQVPVGNIGWDLAHVNIGMSSICKSVMERLDYQRVCRKRRENFLHLKQRLDGQVAMLREDLAPGVCPLFFPILVHDKPAVARALWQLGIGAVEFWNYGDPEADGHGRSDAGFLRKHVLELPIHQGVTESQIDYIADQMLRLGARAPQFSEALSVC